MMFSRFSLLILICLAVLSWGQEPFSGQPARLPASAPLSLALRQALQPGGIRILTFANGLETPVCELWWTKAIATDQKAAGSAESGYGSLRTGTLLGVLYFPTNNEDSQDQELRSGYYTMRYAQIYHTAIDEDTTAGSDFVALSPVAFDVQAQEILPLDTLMQFSRRASRTSQPALIRLVQVNPAYKKLPAVVTDDSGQCILQVGLWGKGNRGQVLPGVRLAILLVTAPKESGGS
ncbi:MAG TPA: hypothetical protein VK639_05410 [Terriglobales bacterium]|nr:hypothetical protein [Terriglobales bacterium]